ncbi:MAG: glycosyltransferase family 39 protein [Cyanobacteria bacterium HKST-UBA04]|nr:glycosyltransferase family 39 protein [Cyanobacteria bacterium HKST-UBA04]
MLQSAQKLHRPVFDGMRSLLSQEWFRVALLAVGLLALFTLNTANYPLFDVDEPRYAETAREMISAPGDWITPYFNHVKRFDKPVLFYWLIALMYQLFGVSVFSARLVSALAATMVALGMYATAQHEVRAGRAPSVLPWLAVAVFATMVEPFFMARWAITDMTLTACMSLMGLCLYLGLMASVRWYMLAGVFCGLGLLTKGPVALALPGLVYLLFAATRFGLDWRQWWVHVRSAWFWGGLVLALCIAAPWYWAVNQANPTEFVQEFVFKHNLKRFTSTVSGHKGAWFYFVPVVLAGSVPWVAFLPGALCRAASHLKRRLLGQWPPLVLYSLIGFVTIFLFFSASNTKLLTYILPAFVPLTLLLAWYAATWFEDGLADTTGQGVEVADPAVPRFERGSVQVMLGLLLVIFGAALVATFCDLSALMPANVKAFYTPWPFRMTAIWVTVGLLAVNGLWWFRRSFQAVTGLVITMAGLLVLLSVTITPIVSTMIQSDLVWAAQLAKADGAVLTTYETKKPSLVFYTQDKVYFVPRRLGNETTTDQLLYHDLHLPGRPLYIVVKNLLLNEVLEAYDTDVVRLGHAYSLVRINPGLKTKLYERKPPVDLSDLPNQ